MYYQEKCCLFSDDDNDLDETMRLERRRQQLQRELSRLEAEDDSDRPTGVEKMVCNVEFVFDVEYNPIGAYLSQLYCSHHERLEL